MPLHGNLPQPTGSKLPDVWAGEQSDVPRRSIYSKHSAMLTKEQKNKKYH
jgi:hypothetical protein